MPNVHLILFIFGSSISLGLWLACADSGAMALRGGTGGGINKILEELSGVNETIYSNLNQFSLLPYCDEAQVVDTFITAECFGIDNPRYDCRRSFENPWNNGQCISRN